MVRFLRSSSIIILIGIIQYSNMCFTPATQERQTRVAKTVSKSIQDDTSNFDSDFDDTIIPGLPDDVAKCCLVLIPRRELPLVGLVSKKWREFLRSREFLSIRKEAGKLEEWIYALIRDGEGKGSQWEALTGVGNERITLPKMPGPVKSGFGVVVLDGNLLVISGQFTVNDGGKSLSSEVHKYDSRVNRWTMLARINVARFDFACAVVNGLVYVVGGYGSTGETLSSVEVYDSLTNSWTFTQSLRCPRWGGFAYGISGKLYVMGGRSALTIGTSRSLDIYNPEEDTWQEMKKQGCVMAIAHVAIGERLFCIEWRNQRRIAVFSATEGSWAHVSVPVTGGSGCVGFRFGVMGGKLMMLGVEDDGEYPTLVYDPDGGGWGISGIKPSGPCLCCVTAEV